MEEITFDFEKDEDVKKAVAFAEKMHKGQVRKRDGVTPYVDHAKMVMRMLISCVDYEYVLEMRLSTKAFPNNTDPKFWKERFPEEYKDFCLRYKDVVMAGVLHDVVEDTHKEISRAAKLRFIETEFGIGVAEIVDVMTEWKDDAYDDRKSTQQKRIIDASRGAKLVKCADNISNLGETVAAYKLGDIDAWKVYKIRPSQVVENHLNTLGSLSELEGNPLHSKLSQIVTRATELAQEYEATCGTEYWDEKGQNTRQIGETDEEVKRFFYDTYKSGAIKK